MDIKGTERLIAKHRASLTEQTTFKDLASDIETKDLIQVEINLLQEAIKLLTSMLERQKVNASNGYVISDKV